MLSTFQRRSIALHTVFIFLRCRNRLLGNTCNAENLIVCTLTLQPLSVSNERSYAWAKSANTYRLTFCCGVSFTDMWTDVLLFICSGLVCLSGTRRLTMSPWRLFCSPTCCHSWTGFAHMSRTSCRDTTWKSYNSSSRCATVCSNFRPFS